MEPVTGLEKIHVYSYIYIQHFSGKILCSIHICYTIVVRSIQAQWFHRTTKEFFVCCSLHIVWCLSQMSHALSDERILSGKHDPHPVYWHGILLWRFHPRSFAPFPEIPEMRNLNRVQVFTGRMNIEDNSTLQAILLLLTYLTLEQ